jgi:hypothetical protein
MPTNRYLDFDCVEVANDSLSLLVTQSVGPRVISLRYQGGENLFAELPDAITETSAGPYHFYGGHRFWRAPEEIGTTYYLDNKPVDIERIQNGLSIQQSEVGTGVQKSIQLTLNASRPTVQIIHTLTNLGQENMNLALWAITQFRPGGVAILPHSAEATGFLPNRQINLWPYTDIQSAHITWGNRYTFVHANVTEGHLKIGFPNPSGWMAYWTEGTLFVKKAVFDPQKRYYDYGSSSECYCKDQFLELETLSPIYTLAPGNSATHTETWEIYGDVESPSDEMHVQKIVSQLGLE